MPLIIAVCLALCILAAMGAHATHPYSDYGLFIPSPEAWGIPFLWNEIINVSMILAATFGCFLINKRFRLLKTSQPLGASFFLPLFCANPLLAGSLTSATILTLVLMWAIVTICSAWKSRNATREAFVTGVIISAGSMIQYAFIPFLAAVFLSFVAMKAMRFKEFLALGLGAIAPYWIAFGLGLINPLEIRIPDPHPIFTYGLPENLFLPSLGCAVLFLCAFMLTLTNGLLLYAGNAEIRSYINVFNIFGITAAIAAPFDIANIAAYTGIFYLWVALQFALFFTLRNTPRPRIIFLIIQALILIYGITETIIFIL